MIHIYYWDNEVNFGDCLADYLIRKLTGDSTFLIQIQKVRRRRIALKTLFSLRLREFYNLISYDSIICTVGSILGWGEGKECVFWGSGFISYSSKFNQGRVLCCRGPLSQKKLLTENGIKCDYSNIGVER